MPEEIARLGSLNKKSEKVFGVRNVPLILYEEVSRTFGTGDELVRQLEAGHFFRQRLLDPNDGRIGRETTICVRTSPTRDPLVMFELWPANMFTLKEDEDSVFYPRPVLEIHAGPASTGSWSAFYGDKIRENCWIKLAHPGEIGATSSYVPFVSMLMIRSHQLAIDPRCVSREYWSVPYVWPEAPDIGRSG